MLYYVYMIPTSYEGTGVPREGYKWKRLQREPMELQCAKDLVQYHRGVDMKPPRGYYAYRIIPKSKIDAKRKVKK